MLNIIPRPNKVKILEGLFVLDNNTTFESKVLQSFLLEYVQEATGIQLKDTGEKKIELKLSDEHKDMNEEGYYLHICPSAISLEANTEKGLFYGLQTLRQLMHVYGREIPCVEIQDAPQYAYRGYMLDVGRHFFDKEVIKRMIDLCAMQKLNVFHFHLTEDQGWRIEIEKYPLLTQIGSCRKETILKNKSDHTPVSGYYSKEDILEIVAYAKERYVKVIPEIDMPGHIRSAIAAYPQLSCEGKKIEVSKEFGIIEEIACAGKESTYTFLIDVLDEVCNLFDTDLFHLGGDEAPKVKWKECPHCQARIKEEGLEDEEALQGYFTNRITRHLKDKGIKVITWNDSLKASNLDKDIIIQHWMDGKDKENVIQAINEDRQVIISDFFNYYLDYPYGMTPLNKTYGFNPVFENVKEDKIHNIIGLEAPLWTEFVKDVSTIDFMTFPRLTAVAERAWTKRELLVYDDFLKRFEAFKKLLRVYNVEYAEKKQVDIEGMKGKLQTFRFFYRRATIREILKILIGYMRS